MLCLHGAEALTCPPDLLAGGIETNENRTKFRNCPYVKHATVESRW